MELFALPLTKIYIKTRITSRYHKEVKKKFLKKIVRQQHIYSPILSSYLNNTFLKFYKLYISAKKELNLQLTNISCNLPKLMRKKIRKFTGRYIIRRKKILKLFYKLLKKKKMKHQKR